MRRDGVLAAARAALLPVAGTILVALLVALPILAHPYLPLADLPNHIARLHVAVTEGGPLAQYYAYRVALVPNSAADLAFLLLGDPADPIRFAQLSLAAYAAGLVVATMILSRVAWGGWSVWPLAVGLVVYNGSFLCGFHNFVLAMPLALGGVALWLGTERRPLWQRLALLLPFASLLYLCHFFAFAFMAIAALGREVQRLIEARGRRRAQLGQAALLALPFLPGVLWLGFESLATDPGPYSGFNRLAGWSDLLTMLRSVTAGPLDDAVPASELLGHVMLVAVALLLVPLLRRTGPRLVLARPLVGPALALGIATLLAPSYLNSVGFVHIRFPFALCALLFAGSRWRDLPRQGGVALALAVVGLVALRGLAFERAAAIHSADMGDLSEALTRLPSGARLLPLFEGREAPARFLHVQAYAVVQRDAFVPTLFQGVHAMTVLPAWKHSSHPLAGMMPLDFALSEGSHVYYFEGFPPVEILEDWRRKFTHVILLGEDAGPGPEIPGLRPLANSGRFTLYEVMPERS